MSDVADAFLIEAAVRGEEEAFAELVGRYQAAVWGTVHRTLGNSPEREDAVQEIFMRGLVSLHKFDRRHPFGPWILRIASNYCIDRLRRRKTRKTSISVKRSETAEIDHFAADPVAAEHSGGLERHAG
jgi:RNA polymerase sigma factor (sigma-70 family)